MNYSIFFDLHGVLANTNTLIENYGLVLRNILKNYNYSNKEIEVIQKKSVKLYVKNYQIILKHGSTSSTFTKAMIKATSNMEEFYKNLVPYNYTSSFNEELKARTIEYQAGCLSNAFYKDALIEIKKFIDDPFATAFIASNSHTNHIRGVLTGANNLIERFEEEHILGWDKIQFPKNTIEYYKQLQQIALPNKDTILVGNTDDEINFASELNFTTIAVKRETALSDNVLEKAKIVCSSLKDLHFKINSINII